MMGFELGILGKNLFQVTTSTGSYWKDEEIKGCLNPNISSPSLFIFSCTVDINVSPIFWLL